MDLSIFDGTYFLLAIVLIAMLLVQNWMINRRQAWLAIFVPVLYISMLVFLAASGRVLSLGDFIFAAFGLLGLLAWWLSVREEKRQALEEREGSPSHSAADPGDSSPPSSARVRRHGIARAL